MASADDLELVPLDVDLDEVRNPVALDQCVERGHGNADNSSQDPTAACSTVTASPKRSRSTAAQSACGSIATTRAPSATRTAVRSPMFAPTSKTRLPGVTNCP